MLIRRRGGGRFIEGRDERKRTDKEKVWGWENKKEEKGMLEIQASSIFFFQIRYCSDFLLYHFSTALSDNFVVRQVQHLKETNSTHVEAHCPLDCNQRGC